MNLTIQVPPDRDWFQIIDEDGEVVISGHRPTIQDLRDLIVHMGSSCTIQEVDPETLG